jgi:hypothetical protein
MFAPAVADRRFVRKRKVSAAYNIPAPTGGLNARDAFTDMDEKDAVTLTNVFPEANYTAVRGGSASWATGMTDPIRSLMTWFSSGSGTDKIFAAKTTTIYDVTASGSGTSAVTSLTSSDWQWTNLSNSGGNFLFICNGADSARAYDGSSWSTPSISGVSSATLVNVIQFKERLWFAQLNSLDAWYLDTQAISGTAHKFPLGAVFRRGGYLQAMGSFSYASSEGPDDYMAFISSNGEIAVYQGTDPTSASTWGLVGIFTCGRPIGRRCTVRYNGDLGIVTQDGIVSMRRLLKYSREGDQAAAFSAKIQTLFGRYANSYSSNFGWEATLFPKARYLIVNVPAITNTSQSQLVMNTVTGAWCQFSGLNAGCWGVANDNLYFGGNAGVVYQANVGFQDSGSSINWEVQTAWQMPGGAMNKMFKMVRPVMLTGAGVSYAVGVDVDFQSNTPTGTVAAQQITGNAWPWTWPGTWGGQNVLDSRFQSVGAIGTWASVHVLGAIRGGACQLNSFDLVAEAGGVL